MAHLTNDQQEKVNKFLNTSGLIAVLEKHMKDNDLNDFEIESVKLKAKTDSTRLTCPQGQIKVEVCSPEGFCEQICMPRR